MGRTRRRERKGSPDLGTRQGGQVGTVAAEASPLARGGGAAEMEFRRGSDRMPGRRRPDAGARAAGCCGGGGWAASRGEDTDLLYCAPCYRGHRFGVGALRTTAPIGSQETDSGTSALFSGHRFVPTVQICMSQIHALVLNR